MLDWLVSEDPLEIRYNLITLGNSKKVSSSPLKPCMKQSSSVLTIAKVCCDDPFFRSLRPLQFGGRAMKILQGLERTGQR